MLFMRALSVSANFNCFWRGSMFKIFSEERAWGKERKRGYTRAFCSLDNGLDLHFLYTELLTTF